MELTEVKVIFDADNIEIVKNEIISLFHEFGISGVKIDEPMERNIFSTWFPPASCGRASFASSVMVWCWTPSAWWRKSMNSAAKA